MHSNSDKIEVMAYDKANEVAEEIFESLLSRCQIGLETWIKGSDFINKYNWEGKKWKDNWKKFDKNTITLLVMWYMKKKWKSSLYFKI